MRLPTFYEQNLIPNWGKKSVNFKPERAKCVIFVQKVTDYTNYPANRY